MALKSVSLELNGSSIPAMPSSSGDPTTRVKFTRVLPAGGTTLPLHRFVTALGGGKASILEGGTTAETQLLQAHYERASAYLNKWLGHAQGYSFKFISQTVSVINGGSTVYTSDLAALRQMDPEFNEIMKDFEEEFFRQHPAMRRQRSFTPLAFVNGNRTGAKPMSNPDKTVCALSATSDHIGLALQWRQESDEKYKVTRTDLDRQILFSQMGRAAVFDKQLQEQITAKINSLPQTDPDRRFWEQLLTEIQQARLALMAGAAMMPSEMTAEAVDRMARRLFEVFRATYQHADQKARNPEPDGIIERFNFWRNGPAPAIIDEKYAVDFGATLLSALPAGRQTMAAYYEGYGSSPKQDSLAGLMLRAVVNPFSDHWQKGLKTGWIDQLPSATQAQRDELYGMVDEANRAAHSLPVPNLAGIDESLSLPEQWNAALNRS